MTSDDSLSLILRRLDEIERKLDRMWPKTWGLTEEMIGRRLSQEEAKRLLAKFER